MRIIIALAVLAVLAQQPSLREARTVDAVAVPGKGEFGETAHAGWFERSSQRDG